MLTKPGDRPFRHLCREADKRDAMSDAEFWERVFHSEPRPDVEWEPDPEVPAIGTICEVCGSDGACGYDPEGRPWIHCTEVDP
jgi:hypothetical protein